MSKEWILNTASMRWQLTRPRNVGKVSDLIRRCSPKTVDEWEHYYFANVHPKEHLEDLGRRLFIKVSEVCRAEIESLTEQDCMDFIIDLVIRRTFDGYRSEIDTIYGQLEEALGVKIHPAPDEWDRGYNVDFFIQIDDKCIGLQIKPAGHAYMTEIVNELRYQEETHRKFAEKFGGRVFYVISVASGKKKVIHNPEIIPEIRAEMDRLRS